MITKIIFTACLALSAASAIAQPNVVFDSRTIDFGTVVEGTICKHRFGYKNTGNQPFIISNVSVTCGCTVPLWSREPLQPGDTASLFIQFDTHNKRDYVSKGVNLTTNSPDPMIGLIILARVIPDSNFKPTFDSLTYKPITVINRLSFFDLKIPLKSLSKKGFKGSPADAEKLIKKIMISVDKPLSQSAWVSIEKDYIMVSAVEKNLQQPIIAILQRELLDKKRMKYWLKIMKEE